MPDMIEMPILKSACKGKYLIAEVDRVRRRKQLRRGGGEQMSQDSLLAFSYHF